VAQRHPGPGLRHGAVIVEALHRAPVLCWWGVKEGFEKIRFVPTATGGPRTHISGGPFDHQLFKGDGLPYGRVGRGKLEFAGLFEPAE
jgi:branched-chain amino acid transport system substrate-binding protein